MAQITLLLNQKITILNKYLYFVNVFLKKLVIELFQYLDINKYAINSKEVE